MLVVPWRSCWCFTACFFQGPQFVCDWDFLSSFQMTLISCALFALTAAMTVCPYIVFADCGYRKNSGRGCCLECPASPHGLDKSRFLSLFSVLPQWICGLFGCLYHLGVLDLSLNSFTKSVISHLSKINKLRFISFYLKGRFLQR